MELFLNLYIKTNSFIDLKIKRKMKYRFFFLFSRLPIAKREKSNTLYATVVTFESNTHQMNDYYSKWQIEIVTIFIAVYLHC
jgi:hypothetical protein